jgi:hypothetical protein
MTQAIDGLLSLSLFELVEKVLTADYEDLSSTSGLEDLYIALRIKSKQDLPDDAEQWALWFMSLQTQFSSTERGLIKTLLRIRKAEQAALRKLQDKSNDDSTES